MCVDGRFSKIRSHLLIRDLRTADGINRDGDKYIKVYEQFLNDKCKIRFHWITDKTSKSLKWRNLTTPEQIRLFENISIPFLFPNLPNKDQLQELWSKFYNTIRELNKKECDPSNFETKAKEWVRLFITIYQKKDVTPYMHAMAQHVPEFLQLHKGNIVQFTHQGVEKLNDVSTKNYQRSSNHRDHEALKQMLQKMNRIELLHDQGYKRDIRKQKCSVCKDTTHNKRACPNRDSSDKQ